MTDQVFLNPRDNNSSWSCCQATWRHHKKREVQMHVVSALDHFPPGILPGLPLLFIDLPYPSLWEVEIKVSFP